MYSGSFREGENKKNKKKREAERGQSKAIERETGKRAWQDNVVVAVVSVIEIHAVNFPPSEVSLAASAILSYIG